MATSAQDQSSQETVGSIESFVTNLSTNLFNNSDLSDVILKVGAKKYHSHKFLLANFSDVLRTMLVEGRWADAKKPVVTLEETPECVKVFDRFLRFMYCGQIDLDINSVVPLLSLSDKYNVQQIKSLCEDYMVRQVENYSNVNGALKWWKFAEGFSLGSLSKSCFELICENLDEALVSKEWVGLHFDHLCKLLETTDLYVTDEYELYKRVAKWIEAKMTTQNTDEYIAKLLPLIRFPHMTPEQLDAVENSQLCQNNISKFGTFLYEAFKFHTMGDKATVKFMGVKFQPRMYGFDGKSQDGSTNLDIWSAHFPYCQSHQYLQNVNCSYTVNVQSKFAGSQAKEDLVQYSWSLAINSVQIEQNKYLILQFMPDIENTNMKYRLNVTLREQEVKQKMREPAIYCSPVTDINNMQRGTVKGILKSEGIVGKSKPHVASLKSQKSSDQTRVTTWLKEIYEQQITQKGEYRRRHSYAVNAWGQQNPENAILCAFLSLKESQDLSITTRIFVYH
ncbi:BTB/POZ domain-containing protein 17-like [Glandiceps talaboti]